MSDREAGAKTFADVYRAELDFIRAKRESGGDAAGPRPAAGEDVPPDLFGVALSGGGIRSACFCLGALQALDAKDLVARMDYPSTVSGGGYAGSGMLAGMSRPGGAFPYAVAGEGDIRDSEPVSHLRDHSRFLAPHGLSDIMLSVAVVLRGLAVNLSLLLMALLPLATLLVLANPTKAHLDSNIVYHIAMHFLGADASADPASQPWILRTLRDPFFVSKFLGLVLFGWLVCWATWRSFVETYRPQRAKTIFEPESRGTQFGRCLITALLIALFIELQPIVIRLAMDLSVPASGEGSRFGAFSTFGALAAGIVAVATFFRERFASWVQAALNSPTIGAKLRGIAGRLAFYAAGLAVPLLVYGLFVVIVAAGIEQAGAYPMLPVWLQAADARFFWVAAALGGLALSGRLIVVAWRNRPTALGQFIQGQFKTKRVWYWIALVFLVPNFLFFAAVATRSVPWPDIQWIVLGEYIAVSFIAIVIGWNFTENANGLHRLYRDRLAQAFRLSDAEGQPLPLSALDRNAPYLLVNAALNVRRSAAPASPPAGPAARRAPADETTRRSPPDPVMRGRNAEFFLFSRNFVGSDLTGYAPTAPMETAVPQLDLATAAAISGAAVSSSMGRFGLGLLGPTLALLNLRLGFWLLNPGKLGNTEASVGAKWHDALRLYLFREMLGWLSADDTRLYITDGGHIDNIGLYQLLKRRCKYIIVVDAEADAAMNFGAFCDVQRFARIDDGVRVTLDWEPVRAASLARSTDRLKQVPPDDPQHDLHYAVGKILYEKTGGEKDSATGESQAEEGILLYVKASVTGDEADYVLDYERRYPNFPHESTAQQFFSEEQMEAYRALGFHAVTRALEAGHRYAPRYADPEARTGDAVAEIMTRIARKAV